MVGPHAGQAVGLQFEPHRQLVALALRQALAGLLHLARDAQQVLHMMADFVRDHVGLGEIARRTEAPAQFVEERHIQIELAVGRAIERSHLGLPHATGAARRPRKQDQRRLLVPLPGSAEDRPPGLLGFGQHLGREAGKLVLGCRPPGIGLNPRRRLHHRSVVEHHARVDAEIHRHQRQQDGADADLAASAQAGALPAPVLDVAAFPAVTKIHRSLPHARGRMLLRRRAMREREKPRTLGTEHYCSIRRARPQRACRCGSPRTRLPRTTFPHRRRASGGAARSPPRHSRRRRGAAPSPGCAPG